MMDARKSPHRAGVVRVVLFLLAALATTRNTVAVSVGSFSELKLSVGSGTRAIEITAPEILFDHQLEVRHTGTVLQIASGIGATLSGGHQGRLFFRHQTRLFFLHNGSKLSLRGVDLVGGVASGTCLECPFGGAIFVSVGGELTLRSARVMDNTADLGGAIYAIGSIVTATDCTINSNYASSWGGAIYADGESTVTATDCIMTSNSGHLGSGAIHARGDSTVVVTDCAMISNSGVVGGAVYANHNSTVTAMNCTMTSNSARWGGVVYAGRDSTFTAIDCTMTSNSASWGGAIYATGHSNVTATDCTMTSNFADIGGGGAVGAGGDSTVVVTDCTMTSNSAAWGGAVYAVSAPTVTATDCTMTSNSASLGGAVYAAGDSTVTATDCTMTSNFADLGGGEVVVGYNSSHEVVATLAHCVLTLNSASSGGAALFVRKSGFVDLLNSVFQSNGRHGDGTGIVNLHGQVQCDVNFGCLPICTVCRDEEMPSLSPKTVPPTLSPTRPPPRVRVTPALTKYFAIEVVAIIMLICIITAVGQSCRNTNRSWDEGSMGDANPLLMGLEVEIGIVTATHSSDQLLGDAPESGSVELTTRSAVMKSFEVSPAPVFVVARNTMRVVVWSPGMNMAAPMIVSPVGRLVSELPFVNHTDGYRLHRALLRSFDNLGENDETRVFMLHLHAQGMHVLLEMVATHIFVAESEPIIVLTGRQVDSDLAGLMACESAVAPSEINEEGDVVGESGAGTARDDDDSQLSATFREMIYDDTMSTSNISSLTMSSSNITSLALPTLISSRPSRSEAASPLTVYAEARDVIHHSRSTGFPAGDTAGGSRTVSTGLPVHLSTGLPVYCRPAGQRSMTPHSWDSDNSSLRALLGQTRMAGEMQARPALSMFLADARTSRKQRRSIARRSVAYRNALTKLCVLGRFLRIARECASLRVLFVEGPAVVPCLAIPADVRSAVTEFTWIGGWWAAALH